MAHFAKIDENNKVVEVLVVDESQEHRGQEFLSVDCGLGGTWIQTSYNNNFRKQFAGIGFTYDSVNDVFIKPQPYQSWILDFNFNWNSPVQRPENNKPYEWNEETLSWDEILPVVQEPIA